MGNCDVVHHDEYYRMYTEYSRQKSEIIQAEMNLLGLTVEQVHMVRFVQAEMFLFNNAPFISVGDPVILEMPCFSVTRSNDAAQAMYDACSKARGLVSDLQRKSKSFNRVNWRTLSNRSAGDHLSRITARQNVLRPLTKRVHS